MKRSVNDLKVCGACGWYEHGFRPNECDPELGKVADEITAHAERLGVTATKLGYGFGRLVFQIDEDTNLQTRPHHDGTFSVEDIFMLGETRPSDVLALVAVLKSLRSRR